MSRQTPHRRQALATVGSGLACALAGCADRGWTQAEESGADQVELRITNPPAEDDVIAARLSSQLREHAETVGIDVAHEPLGEGELWRQVLLEGEYDVFLARHPGLEEFDALTGLLHGEFLAEDGWQNPFGYSDVVADDLLTAQRTALEDRTAALGELFEHLDRTVPYTVIAFSDDLGATRDGFDIDHVPRRPLEYVQALSTEPPDGARDGPLRLGAFSDVLTDRWNPLAVDRVRIPGLVDLVYDPLLRRRPPTQDEDEHVVPWLAETVEWDLPTATVTLRDGLTWHDGTSLTASDVAFTLEFLTDTAMDEDETSVPAPRYRSRRTLIDTVSAVDDRTLEITVLEVPESVAVRALTIPILPEHVWRDRTSLVVDGRTAAIVDDNDGPVGSGVVRVDSVTDDRIELAVFDDHVFAGADEDRPNVLDSFPQFEGLTIEVVPNAPAMIEALLDGEIDATVGPVPPAELERVSESSSASTVVSHSRGCYMLGFNHEHPALGDVHFRRAFARLIDREHVVESILDGYGTAATSQNALVGITDDSVDDPVDSQAGTFPGSDGDLDVSEARSLFADAGYYTQDDTLLE